MRRFAHQTTGLAAGLWALIALATPLAHAQQSAPANTVIRNQAAASYFDTGSDERRSITSNIATIRVALVRAFRLASDQDLEVVPGETVNLAHVLTNTGNVGDSYDLDLGAAEADFELRNAFVVEDRNGNGLADEGEPEITAIQDLEPGAEIALVIVGQIPNGVGPGAAGRVEISAASQADGDLVQTNTDTLTVGEGVDLALSKRVSPTGSVLPGTLLTYRISLQNNGGGQPESRTVVVDGAEETGVLIQDPLPTNTALVADPPVVEPQSGEAVVRLAGTRPWIRFSAWDRQTPVGAVGALLAPAALAAGGQASLVVRLRVNANATAGTAIDNSAFVDSDGDGNTDGNEDLASNPVSTTVTGGNGDAASAALRFLGPNASVRQACNANRNCPGPAFVDDGSFIDAGVYRLDTFSDYLLARDGVYLELDASALNRDAEQADFGRAQAGGGPGRRLITVTVRSQRTGDTVNLVMRETGPNTGRFRGIRPLRLSAEDRGGGGQCPAQAMASAEPAADLNAAADGCVLNSVRNDDLSAEFVAADGAGDRLLDDAVVEPEGLVFNSVTRAPVAGASVTVRNADGSVAGNPDNPGSTLDPIVTGADGIYRLPRLAAGRYYIDVEPPPELSHPSAVAAASFDDGLRVTTASYGRDGFGGNRDSGVFTLAAGAVAFAVDIPLDPGLDAAAAGLSIDKEADTSIATVGDIVRYTVRVQNNTTVEVRAAEIRDSLPFGFKLLPGSVRIDDEPAADPQGRRSRDLVFALGTLAADQTLRLEYTVELTAGALDSDGVNTAVAAGNAGGLDTRSPVARADVEVRQEALFSERAYLFGKIYVDADCDDVQSPGEWPIGGVRLYLEDGTYVVSDENGQYSLQGLEPGLHVLKIDRTTLPRGVDLKPLDNRHAGDPESRFVDLVASDFHRADFAAQCSCEAWPEVRKQLEARNADINGAWRLEQIADFDRGLRDNDGVLDQRELDQRFAQQAGSDGDISSGRLVAPDRNSGTKDGVDPSRQADPRNPKQPGPVLDRSLLSPQPQLRALDPLPPPARGDRRVPEGQVRAEPPDPEQAVKKVTREQAKTGTWLWPPPASDRIRTGRFIVVVPAGINPRLEINGETVAASQLGARLVNKRESAQVLAWYGVSTQPGLNQVRVTGADSFGNQRVLAEREVYRAGKAQRLTLTPRARYIDADGGASYLPVDIQLRDGEQRAAAGSYFVTLEATDGRWLNQDIQDAPGHQIRIDEGRGTAYLQSSSVPGKVDVRAAVTEVEALADVVTVEFVEPLRPLIASGVVSMTARANDLDSQGQAPDNADDWRKDFDLEDRTAFFLKGRIKGDLLLTAAYDSDKRRDDEQLFRDINPRAFYPIYGDASVKGFEAQSRSPLFLKVERGANSAMWGDYLTDAFQQPGLASSRRVLTGANLRLEDERYRIQAFGAESESARRVELLPGNGTAINYRIDGAPIERNSELIELLTFDRENPGRIIDSETLSRFGDYNLDDVDGFLSFTRAIPSQDEAGNPVVIRVTYDTGEDGQGRTVAGLRVSGDLSESLTLGATYTADQNPTDGARIAGADLRLRLGDQHEFLAEIAHYSPQLEGEESGWAGRVELVGRYGERLESRLAYGRAETGFDNRDSVLAAGREEGSAALVYRFSDDLTAVQIEALHSASIETDELRQSGEVSVTRRFGLWRVALGLRHTRQENVGGDEDFTSVGTGVERSFKLFGRAASAGVEYNQDISDSDRRELEFLAGYQLNERARLYGRHEVISSLTGFSSLDSSADRRRTVVGIEADWLASTQGYTEYRQRGGISGRELETASGIRSAWEFAPGQTLSPQFEYINTLDGGAESNPWALSLGYANNSHDNYKTSLRVETRQDGPQDFYGVRGTYVGRVSTDWSTLLREELFFENRRASDDTLRHEFSWGFARRPRGDNRHNMLFLYRWRQERGNSVDRSVQLLSTHQNYKATDDLTLSGNLAAKWVATDAGGGTFDNSVQLLGARVLWALNRRWDLDLHSAALMTEWGESARYGAGLGVNFLVRRNLRLGVGYNLLGFRDRDLDEQAYNAQGAYLGLRFKFDEDLFDWLRPDDEEQR